MIPLGSSARDQFPFAGKYTTVLEPTFHRWLNDCRTVDHARPDLFLVHIHQLTTPRNELGGLPLCSVFALQLLRGSHSPNHIMQPSLRYNMPDLRRRIVEQ